MRALKIMGIGLAALLGVFILALGAFAIWFDPNDYKADIERLVEERTHRRLTLQGDQKLSVFPWLAVQMGPAQLSERAGFGEQPFVSVQNVKLSVRLWPLLKSRIEIGEVQLDAPSIRLITDEQGRHNWSDLAAGDDTAPASDNQTSGAVSASLAGVEIRKGALILENRKEKTRQAISNFTLQTGAIVSGKPFDLNVGFNLEQDQQKPVPVKLATQVTADFEKAVHRLKKLQLDAQWHGAGMPAAGLPLSVRAEAALLDLKLQQFELQALAIDVGQARLTGAVAGKEIFDAPHYQGQFVLVPVALRELMLELGIKPPSTRDAQVLQQVSLTTEFVTKETSLALHKLQLKLDDTTASGEFGIADFASKALRFDLNIDRIDFDRYLPPPVAGVPDAKADTGAAPTPIPVDALRTLNARGDLRIGEAKFGGLQLSKMHLGLNARDGDVRFQPTDATLYGGQYRGNLNLNVVQAPRLSLESHASGIDFAPLFKDMFDSKRITGRGDANVKISAVGLDTAAMKKTLQGTLDFQARDGSFEGIDLWYEIRRARALFRQEAIPARIDAERTAFTSCRGSGSLTNGVLSNKDFDMAMQYLHVTGEGSVDLVQNKLDYRLLANVLRIPKEGAEANAELVDAKIPVTVTGPLNDPKIRPDIQGLVKAEVKKRVNEEKEKLQEKLQDKLQNKLRGILGGS
ncbi:MAG: AsmA family protein [Candidatus Obscuribacterales bacterium]|nr:AsmA family protein [Steroidobacteraceae bacterium]